MANTQDRWQELVSGCLDQLQLQVPPGGDPRSWLGDALIAHPGEHTDGLLRAVDEIYSIENATRSVQCVREASGTWLTQGDTRLLVPHCCTALTYPLTLVIQVYRGDITKLDGVDAIVNAANDRGLGCFIPAHRCIDNVIHRAAGPRLREECTQLMNARGSPLTAGSTPLLSNGYHLPSPYVLHVTGPQMARGTQPSREAQRQLSSCYSGCLDLAAQNGLRSVAFNCISTGLFGYPQREAAERAMHTVKDWIEAHPGLMDLVVFDVFTSEDTEIYHTLAPEIFSLSETDTTLNQ